MPDPSKRLRKSRNRVLAGVCGGIAEWLGWDPTLVRVLYVLVSFFSAGFPGILVYIILWIVMPNPEASSP
ncbi:MAG TPA: PspC domain-containing protein [Candidatus Eisenbacteria bacterium]|jgi:phage shock protein PspC (stress-responsive transcriptional regulator)